MTPGLTCAPSGRGPSRSTQLRWLRPHSSNSKNQKNRETAKDGFEYASSRELPWEESAVDRNLSIIKRTVELARLDVFNSLRECLLEAIVQQLDIDGELLEVGPDDDSYDSYWHGHSLVDGMKPPGLLEQENQSLSSNSLTKEVKEPEDSSFNPVNPKLEISISGGHDSLLNYWSKAEGIETKLLAEQVFATGIRYVLREHLIPQNAVREWEKEQEADPSKQK